MRPSIFLPFLIAIFTTSVYGVTFNNETISGQIVLLENALEPGGGPHHLVGTVTLDDATVDLFGTLFNASSPTTVGGTGVIRIHGPSGYWTNTLGPSVTIGPDVLIEGGFGARFYADGNNSGVIAAVPGGDGGIVGDEFEVVLDDFANDGVLQATDDSTLNLFLRDGLFRNNGLIRVDPNGLLLLAMESGEPLTPSAVGTIENNGVAVFNALRVNGTGTWNLGGSGVYEFQRRTEIVGATINIAPAATANIVFQQFEPSARFSGTTINGVMRSTSGSDADIDGGLTLNGEWRLAHSDLHFQGVQTLNGVGVITAEAGQNNLRSAGGPVTIGPDVELRAGPGGSLSLTFEFGEPIGETFVLLGDAIASGGTLSTGSGTVRNEGRMSAINGGLLNLFATTFVNNGAVEAVNGGHLAIDRTIQNNGSITVQNATVRFRTFDVSGNPIAISDSTIRADVFGQTLSQLETLPRVRSEFVVDEPLDLEGQTLTVADQAGSRWTLGSGGMQNGTVDSEDGFELSVAGFGGAVLRNLTLDANVRIPALARLQVNENLSGSGLLILDGGVLQLSGFGNTGADVTSDALNRISIDPESADSRVVINGRMDNTGRTIRLKSGASWELDIVRQTGITGGRIEADPGVELQVRGVSNIGELIGVTLAADARVSFQASIKQGLMLDGARLTIGDQSNGQVFSSGADFLGDQTLGGTGEVRFEGLAGDPPIDGFSRVAALRVREGRLTIGAGVTVRTDTGDGYVGGGFTGRPTATPLTNKGTLLAENGHTLSLFTSDFLQLGALRAATDSTVEVFDEAFANDGRIEAAGGQFLFSGEVDLLGDSTLSIEMPSDSTPLGQAMIVVEGSADLGGVLEILLQDSQTTPSQDDVFLLLSSTSITGEFDSRSFPQLPSGLYWDLDIGTNVVTLSVRAGAVAGDYNSDGVVDSADYSVWRDSLGAPAGTLPNDIDGGVIGSSQYATWRTNYGAASSTLSSASVSQAPEPNGLLLVAMIGFSAALMRRLPDTCKH